VYVVKGGKDGKALREVVKRNRRNHFSGLGGRTQQKMRVKVTEKSSEWERGTVLTACRRGNEGGLKGGGSWVGSQHMSGCYCGQCVSKKSTGEKGGNIASGSSMDKH